MFTLVEAVQGSLLSRLWSKMRNVVQVAFEFTTDACGRCHNQILSNVSQLSFIERVRSKGS